MPVVTVPNELDGERADRVLAILLGCSRTMAKKIIDAQDAVVSDIPLRAAEKLTAGTVIDATVPEVEEVLLPDREVLFDVVFDDENLIVVDKPAGVVVHPGSGRGGGTLVNGLIAEFPEIVGVGQDGRWGIVHRLDRDTSGLLVVARTSAAYGRLIEMMKSRLIARRYLTVVRGLFTNTTGTIEAPIGRDPQIPVRMHLTRSGKPARTHYRRLAEWPIHDASLLSVTLETGRTHQIRVHMRSIGHPVIGDSAYGRRGVAGDPGRQWLHARQLTFDHPVTGEGLDFLSTLPADLSDSLAVLNSENSADIVDLNGEHL